MPMFQQSSRFACRRFPSPLASHPVIAHFRSLAPGKLSGFGLFANLAQGN